MDTINAEKRKNSLEEEVNYLLEVVSDFEQKLKEMAQIEYQIKEKRAKRESCDELIDIYNKLANEIKKKYLEISETIGES